MAHYAKIENNQVTNIIVADQEFINSGAVGDPTTWIEVQDANGVNIHYAGIGFTYDVVANAFISPKPFDSWILVGTVWKAPVDKPQGNENYVWDESTVSWVISPLGE
jgi:hypothetical protein